MRCRLGRPLVRAEEDRDLFTTTAGHGCRSAVSSQHDPHPPHLGGCRDRRGRRTHPHVHRHHGRRRDPLVRVSAVTLAHTDIPAGLLPFVPKGAHVEVRQIKIEPGGTTGWHYHDADIYALVRQGTLTRPYANCKPVVYKTGDIIVEPGGKSNVHEGTNLGKVPVILDVVYVTPFGKPLSEDSPAPSCA